MTDIRSTDPHSSGHRLARFKIGWNAAVDDNTYTEVTLSRLTWQNLGWRIGATVGQTSEALMDEMYDWCVRHQIETGKGLSHDDD